MLSNLKIENIAIIESAAIDFSNGFNVMTGETGAGKSIVIDALNAVLGERTSRELIRTGCAAASVTAVFEGVSKAVCSALDELGITREADGTLIIRRSISADGKNVCRVNGQPATVGMLKSLGQELVNIHGQHDSQSLLNSEKHFEFLDALVGNEELVFRYRSEFEHLCSLRRELKSVRMEENEKLRRIDVLRFQIDELENARLSPGEWESLREERALFQNSERVLEGINAAYNAFTAADDYSVGIEQALNSAAMQLESSARCYEPLQKTASEVREMAYAASEQASALLALLESLEFDPQRLEQVEERLDELYRLSRKYGADEEEMLRYLDECRNELSIIELTEENEQRLREELKVCKENALLLARELSQKRLAAGERFASKIRDELEFLDMPRVIFAIDNETVEMDENGIDRIEFLISANPGEAPKPLSKIASGGELARIMLAIKCVLADKDSIGTLVFDEIDTGVSGVAAQRIAMKLAEVANGRQVICVTHLAQIAAKGANHLLISKSVHEGKTFTAVETLDFDGRALELSRIIGGAATQLQLSMAREMLLDANRK